VDLLFDPSDDRSRVGELEEMIVVVGDVGDISGIVLVFPDAVNNGRDEGRVVKVGEVGNHSLSGNWRWQVG
jgi:hypothetical protein